MDTLSLSNCDKVSSPSLGYDTPKKQSYRNDVWKCLIHAWNDLRHDDRSHVLVMPSREGLEIEHVLSLGIPEDRIIAIDKSAAVIATSLWRKKFPKVKFFASTVGDCYKKINKKGWIIAAANLDFCTNFSESLVSEFKSFTSNISRLPRSRIAVSVSKGREGTALVLMLKTFAKDVYYGVDIQEPRIACLFSLCAMKDALLLGQGSYISGKMPMAWAVISDDYLMHEYSIDVERALDAAADTLPDDLINDPSRYCNSIIETVEYPQISPPQINPTLRGLPTNVQSSFYRLSSAIFSHNQLFD